MSGMAKTKEMKKPAKVLDPNWWKTIKYDWIPMIDNGAAEQALRIKDVAEVRRLDYARKKMLTTARNLRPIDSVSRLSLLPRTVLPRIARYGALWMVMAAYAVTAILCRTGTNFGEVDVEKFDAGTSIITFMIVFYVGYCYSRYNQMFDDVEKIMHSLTNACMLARVHFKDLNEVHRFWRYCNMLHAAAYTSLTVSYSEDNFFGPVCEKYDLFARDEVDSAAEKALLKKVNLDGEDTRACAMIEVWLLEIVRDNISGPIFKNLNDEVQKMGDSVKRLFSYQYQVLPFVYTHLVSTCCVLYLILTAVVKGLQFEPDSSYTFGLVLPLSSITTQAAAIFGLLEVGDTIMDPFGQDPEDFAVLHFVECTVVASMEMIQVDSVVPRHKTEFYSNQELRASIFVATRMVYRFRARKKRREIEEAQALALARERAEEERAFEIAQRAVALQASLSPPHSPPLHGHPPSHEQPPSHALPRAPPPLQAGGLGRADTSTPSLHAVQQMKSTDEYPEFEVEAKPGAGGVAASAALAAVAGANGAMAALPTTAVAGGGGGICAATAAPLQPAPALVESSREEFRLEGAQSEKPLKVRPPPEGGHSFHKRRQKQRPPRVVGEAPPPTDEPGSVTASTTANGQLTRETTSRDATSRGNSSAASYQELQA